MSNDEMGLRMITKIYDNFNKFLTDLVLHQVKDGYDFISNDSPKTLSFGYSSKEIHLLINIHNVVNTCNIAFAKKYVRVQDNRTLLANIKENPKVLEDMLPLISKNLTSEQIDNIKSIIVMQKACL